MILEVECTSFLLQVRDSDLRTPDVCKIYLIAQPIVYWILTTLQRSSFLEVVLSVEGCQIYPEFNQCKVSVRNDILLFLAHFGVASSQFQYLEQRSKKKRESLTFDQNLLVGRWGPTRNRLVPWQGRWYRLCGPRRGSAQCPDQRYMRKYRVHTRLSSGILRACYSSLLR